MQIYCSSHVLANMQTNIGFSFTSVLGQENICNTVKYQIRTLVLMVQPCRFRGDIQEIFILGLLK